MLSLWFQALLCFRPFRVRAVSGCEARKKWRESVKILAAADAMTLNLEFWLAEQGRTRFGSEWPSS